MKLSDIFNSQAIALNYTTEASNKVPYLGTGLFPAKKKLGLDLKWLKGHNGLPVVLAPSAFDAKSTFRDRVGITVTETQMPFFRESMLVKEEDEQEIMRIVDSNDPYAAQVLERIFNDTQTLIDAANVVPERMIMQLLCPIGGKVEIAVKANGVDYSYNYDKDGKWKETNYAKITEEDTWGKETCDPLGDLEEALDALEAVSGTRATAAIMSPATFKLLRNSKALKDNILAQVGTATVAMTSSRVRSYIKDELGLDLYVYSKKYKDEEGKEQPFYKDNGVMLLPDGAIGSTWYGTTPEERTLAATPNADVSIVNTGVAVSVTTTSDPVNTKTTASEIVLPSFERMDECYFLEVASEQE